MSPVPLPAALQRSRASRRGGVRRVGLRAALFGLALVGLVPVALLFLRSAVEERREAGQRVADKAWDVVQAAVRRHDSLMETGPEVLAAALRTGGARADPRACAGELRALRAALPHVIDLGISDTKGEVRCRAGPGPALPGMGGQTWFRGALAARGFAVGDYGADVLDGRPALMMGLADQNAGGAVDEIAYAALDPAWLKEISNATPLAGDPRATIVDPDGVIVARHPRPEDWVGKPLSERPRETILGQEAGVVPVQGLDGVRRLYAFAPLGTPPVGYVAVAAPTAKAYAAADAALWRSVFLVVVLSVAGIVGAHLVSRRLIVEPTEAVVEASRRLAAGDLSARVQGRRPSGELGQVSAAFDEMASVLEERERALEGAGADLRRSRAQLQAIVDNAPAAIFVQNLEGRYLLVNRGFEALTGRSRTEVVGRGDRDLLGADAAALESHVREVIRTGGPVEREEVVPGPGGPRTVLALRFPLVGSEGSPYSVCGIFHDITERIRAEEQQRAMEDQLERSQRLESLGLLAGGVAHDFNNLLAVILNYTEFALECLAGDMSAAERAEAQEDLGAVLHAARSAAGLTRQLLVFARRDRVESEAELLDLNHILTGLKPLLRRTLSEEVHVELDLSPGVSPILADPVRIEQVVVNLAVNARDAMPRGGRLRLRTEPAAGPGDETRVRLVVSDTGIGMPPEVAAKAFDPFFTTKGSGRGTGLGLSTVYGIVTGMGGEITINSRLGEGTDVIAEFPASCATRAALDTPGSVGTGQGETVLVVEDEEAVRAVTERILSRAGYRVLTAANPLDALTTLAKSGVRIDLLLTDVVMPGLSGPELVRRAQEQQPSLRFFYMSGYSDRELPADRTVAAGDTVLAKPFDTPALLRAVREVLDGADADRDPPSAT